MDLRRLTATHQTDDRDEHLAEPHQTWIALGFTLALVLAMVLVLTLIGVDGADAALLDR